MWRFLLISFLIAHGAVHLAIWATPATKDAPFDPARSWLLGGQRAAALVLASIAAVVITGAGVGLWAHADWWRPAAVVGLGASLLLMVLFFHPWCAPIQLVNAALIAGLVWLSWPAEALVGA